MSLPTRVADTITTHSRVVLVALLLTTALVGAGATMVDDDSSLEQFESDSPEGEATEYIADNFTAADTENTTTVQLVVRGENVLSQESLLESLEFQQAIRENESINATLVEEEPIFGVENVLASTVIRGEEADDLAERGAELEARGEELNATAGQLQASLEEAGDLQREYEELNLSYERGEIDEEEYQQEAGELEAGFEQVSETATADLEDDQAAQFERAMANVRSLNTALFDLELEYEADELSEQEYESQRQEYEDELEGVYAEGTSGVLADEYDELQADSDDLEAESEDLESAGQPPLPDQIDVLEDLEDEEFEDLLEDTLGDESENEFALGMMPSSYEPGSTSADARMIFLTQSVEGDEAAEMGGLEGPVVDTQLELRDAAQDRGGEDEYVVFGFGVISEEIDRSMTDSLAIVGPLALVFVVLALFVAYRDPLDIAMGVAGIVAVLIWTFGFMGWTGIAFNQMFVAIPVLLIGLSIDYAIHVFMRHREQREAIAPEERTESEAARERRESAGVGDTVSGSMTIALAGVGVALLWVTATTAIGFLANLVSPIAPIREFGIVSAVGIVSALIVFGALVPAAKVEIDTFLEGRGFDRRRRAFGTGGGRFSDALAVGAVAARKAPLVVLLVVLLATAGGVYGASQVDTSFDEEDFLAENPPAWTDDLPGPLSPGEYHAKDDLEFVNQNFQREDSQAEFLVRGDVTDSETMTRVDAAEDAAADSDVAYILASGDADVESPLSVMETVASEDDSFNATFTIADSTGDGVPDRNLGSLYDALFEADEEAASEVIHRTDDGEYEAIRLVVSIRGDAPFGETTTEMRSVADGFEAGFDGESEGGGEDEGTTGADTDSRWNAIATGDPIVSHVVEQDLLDTVLESLLITLVAVFAFLTVAYWATGNSASLGAITLLPVAFSVSWILGTMYLLGMPFNVLTGMITSLTIGLGVAYSIHISARYTLELDRQGSVWDAMHTTVTGTGGALLGSAATTVGGFGTLAFAILPVLQQFGIITALTIVYAFLASVIVLPTLLVLWTRYFGPDISFETRATDPRAQPASDGGNLGDDRSHEDP